MSKGLEALERLVDGNLNEVNYYRQFCDSTTYIMKDKELIEKELKVLEIIRNKGIHCGYVKRTENLSNYNANVPFREELTQKEYDLLKEVLL